MSFGPDSGPDLACAPAFLARGSGPAQTVVLTIFSGLFGEREEEEGAGGRGKESKAWADAIFFVRRDVGALY